MSSPPSGLAALLFVELGERFSEYGMRALLALLLAGIVIVRGQCSPLRSSIPFFYLGLALIAIGARALQRGGPAPGAASPCSAWASTPGRRWRRSRGDSWPGARWWNGLKPEKMGTATISANATR
jgi:hypothetical protein